MPARKSQNQPLYTGFNLEQTADFNHMATFNHQYISLKKTTEGLTLQKQASALIIKFGFLIVGACQTAMQAIKARLNPRKLLRSKWTAVTPVNKEKHFMITKLIIPDPETQVVEAVELEAVMTRRKQVLAWRSLQDVDTWKQGWCK